MNKKHLIFIGIFFLLFVGFENKKLTKSIILVVDKNTCDLPGSTSFENIKDYYGNQCFETNYINNSTYIDSISILLEQNNLEEDTISKKLYGFGLIAYINITSEKQLPNEVGIDKSGSIFNNDKIYFSSSKLNFYLSQLSITYSKIYNPK